VIRRSSRGALQRWAARAIAAFLVVYLLGAFGVPTFVPYLAVVIAVVVDAVRLLIDRWTARPRPTLPFNRDETIH